MTLSLRDLVFSAAVLGGCAHTSSIAAFDIGAEQKNACESGQGLWALRL